MTSNLAIEAVGLKKSYHDPKRGRVEAVRGVDLAIRQGEVFGLLGQNGAGKTTTLRMLASILPPTEGVARIDGIDVVADPIEARRRLGFLSGSTGLYPRLTPRETLRHFGVLHGLEGAELERRIAELLGLFDMEAWADGRCEALSTGQRQKVSISRALLHDPAVLILAEPTTGLDVLASSAMIEFIESRRASGTCVLLSTHVLSEAERLCDRIGIIHHGRVLACGSLEELQHQTGEEWLEDVFKRVVLAAEPAAESNTGAKSK